MLFANATALTPTADEARFAADVPPDWGQGRAAFGGVVGGLALRAAEARTRAPRRVRSLALSFVAPLAPGPAEVETVLLREGRSLSHIECRIVQEGTIVAVALVAAGADRPGSVTSPADRPPEVPGPDGLDPHTMVPDLHPEFTAHFDYRWTVDSMPFSGATDARVQGWIRPRQPEVVDAALVVALMDAWPPPAWSLVDRPAAGSSVNWHVTLTDAAVPSAAPVDSWWLYDAWSSFAGNGYSDLEARLWDRDGNLLACSHQLFADFTASARAATPRSG